MLKSCAFAQLGMMAVVLVGGCRGSKCTSISDPTGFWSRAARATVNVYGASSHCVGGQVAGNGAPLFSRTFRTSDVITIDVSPGHRAIQLTLFQDDAGTIPIASGCTERDFAASSAACLDLTLDAVSLDAGVQCDGGVCCTISPDSCPTGMYCNGGVCVAACDKDADCVGTNSADGGVAVMACCNHQCVDISSNANHCGECGLSCSSLNGIPACAAGACTWSCASGFGHCASGNTGCETNLNQAGLRTCANGCVPAQGCCASQDCTSPPGPAACYVAACSGDGGFCAYSLPSGNVVCGTTCCRSIHGTCKPDCTLACDTGFADCDGNPANGCEQSLYDVNHCGGCWNICAFPNAIAACPTGTCFLSACAPGYQHCNGQTASGCECAGTTCCPGGACQVQHSNGLGQTFFDCVAQGTYNLAQAAEACAAFTGDDSQCHLSTSCAGALTGVSAVCSDGSATACDCWIYGGSLIGHVKTNSAGSCNCNVRPNAPSWN